MWSRRLRLTNPEECQPWAAAKRLGILRSRLAAVNMLKDLSLGTLGNKTELRAVPLPGPRPSGSSSRDSWIEYMRRTHT
jgi:hypothetical protein